MGYPLSTIIFFLGGFMCKTALIFSGQGSQYVGMGKGLAENSELLKICTIGSEILGFDLFKAMTEDENALSKTLVAQPAVYAVSVMAFEAFKNRNIPFHAVAGHSLGEYAAMVAAEMTTVEQGFEIIKHRAAAMEKAAKEQPGGMAAVIGLDAKSVSNICDEVTQSGFFVSAVNFNSPSQTVIAGTEEALTVVTDKLKEAGAKKVVRLSTAAAFHTKMMQSAADAFYESIQHFSFKLPVIDFYSNISGNKTTNMTNVPSYLAEHMVSPVLFTDELYSMRNNGITNYIELGPGKVVSGLVKKTLDDVSVYNIEDVTGLDKLSALIL
jgi:[acyl-carrier-protein] S-malonyltransferase